MCYHRISASFELIVAAMKMKGSFRVHVQSKRLDDLFYCSPKWYEFAKYSSLAQATHSHVTRCNLMQGDSSLYSPAWEKLFMLGEKPIADNFDPFPAPEPFPIPVPKPIDPDSKPTDEEKKPPIQPESAEPEPTILPKVPDEQPQPPPHPPPSGTIDVTPNPDRIQSEVKSVRPDSPSSVSPMLLLMIIVCVLVVTGTFACAMITFSRLKGKKAKLKKATVRGLTSSSAYPSPTTMARESLKKTNHSKVVSTSRGLKTNTATLGSLATRASMLKDEYRSKTGSLTISSSTASTEKHYRHQTPKRRDNKTSDSLTGWSSQANKRTL